MSANEVFFDTNVLLYMLSGDPAKADRAEALIGASGVISVQVLNEFASVASRRLGLQFTEIREILSAVRAACAVEPLSVLTHDLACDLAERFRLSFYDAVIVAAAILAKSKIVYSEDMQHGQTIDSVQIRSPFIPEP
jgi:predicted nucleic acid-binding protein